QRTKNSTILCRCAGLAYKVRTSTSLCFQENQRSSLKPARNSPGMQRVQNGEINQSNKLSPEQHQNKRSRGLSTLGHLWTSRNNSIQQIKIFLHTHRQHLTIHHGTTNPRKIRSWES